MMQLVSSIDGGVTTLDTAAAALSSVLKDMSECDDATDAAEVPLPAPTSAIVVVRDWMQREQSEGFDDERLARTKAGITDLARDPLNFAAVLALADFLSLEGLLTPLVTASLVGGEEEKDDDDESGVADGMAKGALTSACDAVPAFPTILSAHIGKLVTIALQEDDASEGAAERPAEDRAAFKEYICYKCGGRGEGGGGEYVVPKRLLKLLFSTVKRGDAATLRAVLEHERVRAIGPENFDFNSGDGVAYLDLGDSTYDDEDAIIGKTLLEYAAELGAAGCAYVILELGVEKVGSNCNFKITALHEACWHGHAATVNTLLEGGLRRLVNQSTHDHYCWQHFTNATMGCTPLHYCFLGAIDQQIKKKKRGGDTDDEFRAQMHTACARLLLDAGAAVGAETGPVDLRSDVWWEGPFDRPSQLTALHLATIAGDAVAVRLLIEVGDLGVAHFLRARGVNGTRVGREEGKAVF